MKCVRKSNYRITVEPAGLAHIGGIHLPDHLVTTDEDDRQEQYKKKCEEMVDQIKRHVDGIAWVGIECDSGYVCSHCHGDWEEADGSDPETPEGMPCCCEDAIKEWKDEQLVKS